MKTFEYIIAFLLFLLYVISANCASVQAITNSKNTTKAFLLNKHTHIEVADICLVVGFGLDGARDAMVFKGAPLHPKWHGVKNASEFFITVGAGLKGIGAGKALIEGNFYLYVKKEVLRFMFGSGPLMWVIWQDIVYDYVKYDKMFDYRPAYNKHRYMLPFFGNDKYADWINEPYIYGGIDAALITGGILGYKKFR